jgi:putative lipoprotein
VPLKETSMSDRKHVTLLSRRQLLGFAALALSLPVARPALAKVRTLLGTVSYRERIALPPHAILEVRLVDLSMADAPSGIVAVVRVRTRRRMPIPYRLRFDDKHVRSNRSYALQARILVDGKLWFITPRRHPVIRSPVQPDMLVQRTAAEAPEASAPSGKWLAESIRNGGVIDNLQSTVEIARDGKITGSSGCNSFSGQATITGQEISCGPLAATKMACAPAVMDQEARFLGALADARRWMIDEKRGKLILFDAGNREILLLARM